MSEAWLKADPWLSGLFDKSCFHISLRGKKPPTPEEITKVLKILGPSFIDVKIDVSQVSLAQVYQKLGFQLIDTNVIFETAPENLVLAGGAMDEGIPLRGNPSLPTAEVKPGIPLEIPKIRLRWAEPQDEETVAVIARRSFQYSRFHLDPLVPQHFAHKVKEDWARNFFRGERGQKMVLAEINGNVVGFNQLYIHGHTQTIDLIATHEGVRGQGVARALIQFGSLKRESEITLFRVGTQVANVPSVRLYESLGFRLKSASYVLHYHK